jgi:IS5 family transposase
LGFLRKGSDPPCGGGGWEVFEEKLGPTFCEDNGRPGLPIRLMVRLHYLKYTYSLSDEAVIEG